MWSRVFRRGAKCAEVDSPTKAEIVCKAFIKELGGSGAIVMPLGKAFVVQLYKESGKNDVRMVQNETVGTLRAASQKAVFMSSEL
jgi:hypothetical protein